MRPGRFHFEEGGRWRLANMRGSKIDVQAGEAAWMLAPLSCCEGKQKLCALPDLKRLDTLQLSIGSAN
jgi:hypothetical protein